MLRRALFSAALGLLLATFGLVSRAGAGGVYPPSCGFVLDPPSVSVGGEVHILGSGFEPGADVVFTIDGDPFGTTVADDDGTIDATFPLPEGVAAGELEIATVCPDGNVASNVLIVGGGNVTTTAPLPTTGSGATADLVRLAVGLVVVGALVLVLARRRTRRLVPA